MVNGKLNGALLLCGWMEQLKRLDEKVNMTINQTTQLQGRLSFCTKQWRGHIDNLILVLIQGLGVRLFAAKGFTFEGLYPG